MNAIKKYQGMVEAIESVLENTKQLDKAGFEFKVQDELIKRQILTLLAATDKDLLIQLLGKIRNHYTESISDIKENVIG
jgi:hypothetical protein